MNLQFSYYKLIYSQLYNVVLSIWHQKTFSVNHLRSPPKWMYRNIFLPIKSTRSASRRHCMLLISTWKWQRLRPTLVSNDFTKFSSEVNVSNWTVMMSRNIFNLHKAYFGQFLDQNDGICRPYCFYNIVLNDFFKILI